MASLVSPVPLFDVKVYKLREDAILPSRQGVGNAGYDLHTVDDFQLASGQRVVVSTGLVVQPPPGYHTEILLRSSMAFKYNIMLINSVGLIDYSYAGEKDELKVMLYRAPLVLPSGEIDRSVEPVYFERGSRIAQLVFRQTNIFNVIEVQEAPGKTRGGLGSTGK